MVAKMMTTKFPLCAAVMQLASTLTEKKQKLRLNWAPRDQNYEADELSNGITHRFSTRNQVKVEPILRELKVFNKMLKYGRSLYEEVEERKEERKRKRAPEERSNRKPGEKLKDREKW